MKARKGLETQRMINTATQASTIGPKTKRLVRQGRKKHVAPKKGTR